MKNHEIGTRLCILLSSLGALACTLAVLGAVTHCRGRAPLLLEAPKEAAACAVKLMDAICEGDFSEAETMLYGQPDLGADRLPEDPVGQMIWRAYLGSLDYRLVGEPYPSDTGLVQQVKFISMEPDSVTKNLNKRARDGLNEAIAGAEDVSELYDGDMEYRQELVRQILEAATREALEEDVRYTYQILPLQLIYSDGQWLAVADGAFLDTVFCGIAG